MLAVAMVVVLGAIMSILDMTVVNVALPTFQRVRRPLPTIQWTMTGYTLALATVIPLTGWAADRFGTKRLYMIVAWCCSSSARRCAGMAWNIRVADRLPGPAGPRRRHADAARHDDDDPGPPARQRIGRVMSVLGVPMLLGPIAGPILGGWLVDGGSWHWIFFINLPIGIVALFLAWRVLAEDSPHPGGEFDFLGLLLLSPGLAAVHLRPGHPGAQRRHRLAAGAHPGRRRRAAGGAASCSTRCARTTR